MTIMEERGGENKKTKQREKNNIVTCEETHKKTSSARRETMIPLLCPHAWPLSPSHFFTKTAFKTLTPTALGQSISCRTVIAEVA
jgi:hypothetical protein